MSATDATRPADRFLPGQILAGRYRVVERVGKGGMGEVYRAEDLRLGQPVALKFLPADLAQDPERLEALAAEVRVARQVSHPNVCRVHDLEEVDGTWALAMEFVDGEDLASLLRRIGRLPADKAVAFVHEICAGLAAVHDRGVLHRDLKPANIMVDGRGHARITDFGLAEAAGATAEPGMLAGTPAYMAPESFSGAAPTVQSDLYGLGLVMYELFTGRAAYESMPLADLVHARREGTPPPSPGKVQRDLDPRVERAILRCLERAPARRPRSAREVAGALPGGDRLAAVIAAGETPSPELVAAATSGAEGLRPALAWAGLAALGAGVFAVLALAPLTRLVPRVPMPEPPQALEASARALIRDVGPAARAADRARGFAYHEELVDHVVATDRAERRWDALARPRPPVVTFWYRESVAELAAPSPGYRVTWDAPAWRTGMTGVELDPFGRLQRYTAPPRDDLLPVALAPALGRLYEAAGIDTASLRPAAFAGAPPVAGDQWLAFTGVDRAAPPHPVRVDVVAFRGHPVSFAVRETSATRAPPPRDPSALATHFVLRSMRPALVLVAMLVGAWLARRNWRARRVDLKRTVRVAFAMLAIRIAGWALGGHHTLGLATEQLSTTLAWGLWEFAYGAIFYVAIEPYVRRLWPRMLTSWVRLLDGRFGDARVGRDLLLGSLAGVAIALLVAAHQAAPLLLGAPPARPDHVGYVESQLAALLGPRAHLAEIVTLLRSSLGIAMGFVVILVVARIVVRHAGLAMLVATAIFVPLGLPRGEFLALNLALAIASVVLLLVVLMRAGLLAAVVALVVHMLLQSAPLGLGIGEWPTDATVLPLALVLALGVFGFVRALGGAPAFRDVLPPPN